MERQQCIEAQLEEAAAGARGRLSRLRRGGYKNGAAVPTPELVKEIRYVDTRSATWCMP